MRVLMTSWGSRGDVEPLVGLAMALRELGAEARISAPPDEELAASLERAGVPLVPLGPTVHSVVAGPKPPTGEDALKLAPALVAARFETLTPAAEGCDVLLATGLLPAGARDVAEKLGIPYVYAAFHIFGHPSRHFPPGARPGTPSPAGETDIRTLWRQDAERVNALYGGALNTHRAAIGLPPVDDVRGHVFTDRPWLAADATLCPSEGMTDAELVQTGAWIRPDDRPLPDELEKFLKAGPPPVYVGFGSMAAHAPKDIARVAVEAVRARGRRILLGRGWAGLTSIDDAGDCFVVGEVNQQALFRRVAAVVHHGGAGTTTTASLAGAPQVVVPRIADQPYWAARVAELGIGVAHQDPTPTVESLSAALTTVLTVETRERAKVVSGKIRTDGATVAAKMLFDLVKPA
ncbi:glycosyltransferase [Amycolatopsis regifaucium]|uniref:Glycosyl transferase n=1 Tax=Amycolatopsis regifaucium TaxID=546365 RepID=A0A154MEK0_9PSEU|nr:glycosyltransferase [Amycolatopsis regifaucium]KZB82978.1 glycosyl transferase [Amycolatopsis regifaucium]OKA11355.1 glycosyl transferase [Amycolatopsis regifaucium]SFH43898.1 UDP:flavonoid glycosyltransferase YjiC, YdhE family [Amycolatopsis regifaucium]